MNALTKVFAFSFAVAILFACGGGQEEHSTASADSNASTASTGRVKILSVASDGVMSVQLPFTDDGEAFRCTQNSHDTPTHSSGSTMSDLDFGMGPGTIVVAAASGVFHRATDADANGYGGGFGWYGKVDHRILINTFASPLLGFGTQSPCAVSLRCNTEGTPEAPSETSVSHTRPDPNTLPVPSD